MRALIKGVGGRTIGTGHIVRSIELAEELQRRGVAVVGFLCNEDRLSRKSIKGGDFKIWSDPAEDKMSKKNLEDLIVRERVDSLIIDQPGDLMDLCGTLKAVRPDLFIAALDHFGLDNEYLDMIVNLFNHHPILKNPTPKQIRYYEGVQYGIIRKSFDTYIDRKKKSLAHAKNILVSFGGSDPQRITIRVLEALKKPIPPEISFHFVLGPLFIHKEIVKGMIRQLRGENWFYENVINIEELMYACDAAVGGAGTTMLELACLGTPAIIIAQNSNEARFADEFAYHGAVKSLGLAHEVEPYQVREAIIALARDQTERHRMSMAGKRLIDGRGRERLAELIVRDYGLFRKKYG